MSTLTTQEVNALFDEHQVKFLQLNDSISQLRQQYTSKMWHEMTDNLVRYVKDPAFDASGEGNELI